MKTELEILKEVKFRFDICSDHSTQCLGYRNLCRKIEELEQSRQAAVSGSLLSDTDYWKQRCLLAEQCLEESPCDPDITADQIKAWNAYHKFIGWASNDR